MRYQHTLLACHLNLDNLPASNQDMHIAIPKEVMTGENRVALTPQACAHLHRAGHTVAVQHDAGLASGYDDGAYRDAGCRIVDSLAQLYAGAELIVKVKQPLAQDLACLRAHHTVFGYFHLAADRSLIERLCDIGLTAIAFESVRDAQGRLPLLAPMSAIAGRIAVIRGASLLFRNRDGRGVLLGGIEPGDEQVDHGKVVVLGAGVAGRHALTTALGLGAQCSVFDVDRRKLDALQQRHRAIVTHMSHPDAVAEACREADLVIGAVLVAGRRAPVVLTETMLQAMQPGSVVIDIAIDQGGCVENSEVTDSQTTYKVRHGVLLSAVPNMPAAVPRTATQALSAAIADYVLCLANGQDDASLEAATAIRGGRIVDAVLREETAA